MPRKANQWRRPWRGTNISCAAASRLSATREKSSRGIVREDRADHEQSRAAADDRERNPIDLAVDLLCCGMCVPAATLPDVLIRIGKTIWDAASECSTIYVMDQCHAWCEWANNISATVPKKEGARRQLPRPRHHRAEASWPIDQVRFSGTVRQTTAPGGRWESYK